MGHFMLSTDLFARASYHALSAPAKCGYVETLALCSAHRNRGLFGSGDVRGFFGRRWRSLDELCRGGYVLDEGSGEYSLPLEEEKPEGQWLTVLAMDGLGTPVAKIANPAYMGRMPISQETRRAVMKRDRMVCGLCRRRVEYADCHIDHIIPWSLGGSDSMDNLQVAHAFCNMSKGNRV